MLTLPNRAQRFVVQLPDSIQRARRGVYVIPYEEIEFRSISIRAPPVRLRGTPRGIMSSLAPYVPGGGCRDNVEELMCYSYTSRMDGLPSLDSTKRQIKGNSQGVLLDLNNMVVWCPNVKNNNCFFACVKYYLVCRANEREKAGRPTLVDALVSDRVDKWRQNLGIPVKCLITFQHIRTFVDSYLHRHVVIFDEHHRKITEFIPETYASYIGEGGVHYHREPINIVLFREHYFILHRATLQQFSCEACGLRNIINIEKHICSATRLTYFQQKIQRVIKYEDKRPIRHSEVTAKAHLFENFLFYDFETFFNGVKHQVYAVGLCHWKANHEKYYAYYYGMSALDEFMSYLEQSFHMGEELTLVSYNGSNFDHYFVLEHQIKYGLPMDEFLMNKGRLLQINFWNHKVLDLFNFLGPVSLDANCESYQIPVRKGVFPHLYAKVWQDVLYQGPPLGEDMYPLHMRAAYNASEKPLIFDFKQECLTYLASDVECLVQLTEKFVTAMWEEFQIFVPHYLTLSQVAFELWRTTLNPLWSIPIPDDPKLYDCVNQSTYGGRCHFVKRCFTTSHPEGTPYDQLTDYLVDLDVVSLYPASMIFEKYPCGKMSLLNNSADMEVMQAMLENGQVLPMGIFHVSVCPPTHLIVPPLPRKNDKGHTVWDLRPSESQYYTNVDLETGQRYGYQFCIKSAYVFDSHAPLFVDYIRQVFTKKAEQDVFKSSKSSEYNPAKRELFKKMMNALYGKMMQKRQSTEHEFVDENDDGDHEKWLKFLDKHSHVEYHPMGENLMMLTGDKLDFKKTVSKPHYLGAFILSYSRQIMNRYFDIFDTERLKKQAEYDWQKAIEGSFYYTDTDSLIVHSSQMDAAKDEIGKKLGELADELSGGKIIEGYFLSPKLYCVKYMLPDGSLHIKKRAKGIPNHLLDMSHFRDMYHNNDPARYDFVQLRRIQESLNKPQETNAMQPFTIISVLDAHRTLNQHGTYGVEGDLGGRRILADVKRSVPFGFEIPVYEAVMSDDTSFDQDDFEAEFGLNDTFSDTDLVDAIVDMSSDIAWDEIV